MRDPYADLAPFFRSVREVLGPTTLENIEMLESRFLPPGQVVMGSRAALQAIARNLIHPESSPVSIRRAGQFADLRWSWRNDCERYWGVRVLVARDHLENELRTMAAVYGIARSALEVHQRVPNATLVGVMV